MIKMEGCNSQTAFLKACNGQRRHNTGCEPAAMSSSPGIIKNETLDKDLMREARAVVRCQYDAGCAGLTGPAECKAAELL